MCQGQIRVPPVILANARIHFPRANGDIHTSPVLNLPLLQKGAGGIFFSPRITRTKALQGRIIFSSAL